MKKGFSFIELLVTISLMGLILGLVLVNFGGFNKAKLLSTAADQLVVDLRLVASQAASADKPESCKSPTDLEFEGYQAEIMSATAYQISAVCDGAEYNSVTKELTNGVLFDDTVIGTFFTFYPLDDGADSVAIILRLDALTQTIQVDEAGVVYAE
ncbi:prepilin-type N-terminal cleavage/methylation domain-containing protein [Patescibacteria group bacterium]|nr:prepilin-type N-terminal cleavage/methylation domain-containing protein [Patescibacteria group bacterium]MBU1931716.1 prepilin-type N-terminal cleavage/methylation domain-containing protein [Patescibacteria group bacterium]